MISKLPKRQKERDGKKGKVKLNAVKSVARSKMPMMMSDQASTKHK